jgi:bifunctional non-homologous end joining protein LigD
MKTFVEPELATLTKSAPSSDDWLHELKLDGYRMQARCDGKRVKMLTRRGLDWSARMPSIVSALAELELDRAVLDGELVVLRDGVSDFQSLQNSLSTGRDGHCVYYAFDLLAHAGQDLRSRPLIERKALLSNVLGKIKGKIRLSEHVRGSGAAVFAKACKLGLEGIVSKRADAPYRSGRGKSWLKVKCIKRQELVIGGFTSPSGSRAYFGSLLLGAYEDGQLKHVGRVGTGFTAQSLAELHRKLVKLERAAPPFSNPPRGADARDVHWVAPELVAEIAFAERTQAGIVRHASFQGLREDKPAREVHDDFAAKAR